MPKRKSEVWNYFALDKNRTYCECQHCGKHLKYCGSTTSLIKHLESHNVHLGDGSIVTTPCPADNSQPTIPDVLNILQDCDQGGKLNIQFTNDLASMIACCGLPMHIVESQPFKVFFRRVVPRYKLPSRNNLRSTIMKKFERVKGNILLSLTEVQKYAVTFDSWTDPYTTRSYLGITLHYVINGVLTAQVIAVRSHKESHTAANIAHMLEDVLAEWNIKKESIVCCVTDNAANVKLATELLLGKNSHVPCFAHTLNLCVNDIIQSSSEFQKLLNAVKEIVTFIKKSSVAKQILQQSQADEGQQLKVKQSCPTRWNSVYVMLSRFIEIHVHIHMTLIKCSDSPLMPSQSEIVVINEVIDILKPFFQATEELSAEKRTTISKVIPICNLINKSISLIPTTTAIATELKSNTIELFKKRFGSIEKSKFHAVATVLDPRFKRNDFADLSASLAAVTKINQQVKDSATPLPPLELTENHGLWSNRRVRSSDVAQGLALDESLKLYLNSQLSKLDECPIEIWNGLKQLNPGISKLALEYLIIPATSVPSERIFSKAGRILNRLRSSLDPKLAEELIILAGQNPELIFNS